MKDFSLKNSTVWAGDIDKDWTSSSVLKVLYTKAEETFRIQNTHDLLDLEQQQQLSLGVAQKKKD